MVVLLCKPVAHPVCMPEESSELKAHNFSVLVALLLHHLVSMNWGPKELKGEDQWFQRRRINCRLSVYIVFVAFQAFKSKIQAKEL